MKEIIMPKFGFNQETAEIVNWLVKPGERVERGQPIAEVTTDKINMEVEAPESGVIDGLQYQQGAVVPVTVVIGYILSPGETLPAGFVATGQVATPAAQQEAKPEPPQSKVQATPLATRIAQDQGVDLGQLQGSGPGGRVQRKDVEAYLYQAGPPGKVRAVPAARRLARERGVDLAELRGSGVRGRIQSSDVPAAMQQIPAASTPPPPATTSGMYNTALREIIPLVGMRRTIAERLQKSAQEAPHITFDIDVDVSAAEALRGRANNLLKPGQKRVSLTAILAKSVAWALQRNPLLNAWMLNTPQGQEIHVLASVNLGIAVALETGLIVPVVPNAASKGILQLSEEINDLAERARSAKLRPDEVAEGTFTLTNLGMFGIDRFSAIINPPQVAILAASRISKQFIPGENDQPVVRPLMTLTLSADHRAVDGAVAARFMADLRQALEKPDSMTL